MSKNALISLIVVVAVLVVGGIVVSKNYRTTSQYGNDRGDAMEGSNVNESDSTMDSTMDKSGNENAAGDAMMGGDQIKDPVTGSLRNFTNRSEGELINGAREFSMDSYYDGSTSKAIFTLGELIVHQGDKVRINVNNTFGKHDVVIDEFNVRVVTPQGEITPVEFTADKTGEFIYYCSMPTHRAKGQWGILKVI